MSVFALVERLEREMELITNSREEAAALSSKLKKVQVGLQEAEREGVTNTSIKNWLKELEVVVYEVDDVLDEWATVNLQVEAQDTSLNWDKVCSLLISCFNQLCGRREITKKMKALSVRIDTIIANRDTSIFVPGKSDDAHKFKQLESTSQADVEFKTYGLDDVKNSLVEKLVSEGEGSDKDTQVISIVGVGGIGKSTLARVAYNDPEVHGHFAPKGWVSVSQSFDASTVARAILEAFKVEHADAKTLETLAERVKKAVEEKKFLLVLDNVWVEDQTEWGRLRNCLHGGKGSRIVVTTRLESVTRVVGTTKWQSLDLLTDKDCGTILNGIALYGIEITREKSENLRAIGMDIAKKCKGLPLAAKSIGSMLNLGTFTEQEWWGVLKSPIWTSGGKESNVFSVLNLSYTDLSPLLKRCFLTSVFFPKGTEIRSDEIIRLWLAYGYLNSSDNVDEVQLEGEKMLNDLVMRSFFQKFESKIDDCNVVSYIMHGRMSYIYKMHDIIHDFGSYVYGSDGYSFIRDGGLEKEKSSSSSSSSHNNLLLWNSRERLRTFCVSEELELRSDIISHLTKVRVLSMIECNLDGLPKDIGKLIHLRYLNVSDNPITQLPETITDLCNLQTLDIRRCENLSSLPEGIGKLINLKHLVNRGTYSLSEFPQGLGKLSGLRTLSLFQGRNVGLLRNLDQLQGSLSISLKNPDEREFGSPILWKKENIKTLELEFGMEEQKDEVVEALKPPPNLLTLTVTGHSVKWFSRWIHSSFVNVKAIVIKSYFACSDVPPFCILPALEELEISMLGFECLNIGFLGLDDPNSSSIRCFPRLKKLVFAGCSNWKEWEDIEEDESVPVMPLLKELEIRGCTELEALPHRLLSKASSLRLVTLLGSEKVCARYNMESEQDMIPQVPNKGWVLEGEDLLVLNEVLGVFVEVVTNLFGLS